MAYKPDVQYIRYYETDGSLARKLELPVRRRKPRPKVRAKRERVTVVRLDLLAVAGIVTAAVMVVLMIVGMVRLDAAKSQQQTMRTYVAALEEENGRLSQEYAAGFDPDAVRDAAMALGMVPADSVQKIPIQVTPPAEEEQAQPTVWERIQAFFSQLFA